jgi:hypothetical protein
MTLNEVFEQAKQDSYASILDGDGYEARVLYGCKILRENETGEVTLLNTQLGGDYYEPLNREEIEVFQQKGWRCGVYVLSLNNYRSKLNKVEKAIHKEMNGRRNPKQIQSLKSHRERLMNRYTFIKQKFNLIK